MHAYKEDEDDAESAIATAWRSGEAVTALDARAFESRNEASTHSHHHGPSDLDASLISTHRTHPPTSPSTRNLLLMPPRSASSNRNPRPAAGNTAQPTTLALRLRDPWGGEVRLGVGCTTEFGKVKETYCAKVGADVRDIRLYHSGEFLPDNWTPEDLELEDGHVIQVEIL